MGSDGSPAISYAEYLARTPSIAEATPDRTEELTMQIVSFKTEIDALNAEIEGIYKIVLAHEVEVARALDAKNLEVSLRDVDSVKSLRSASFVLFALPPSPIRSPFGVCRFER
jgi:hypothetical protein